jgi:hypothetical protein
MNGLQDILETLALVRCRLRPVIRSKSSTNTRAMGGTMRQNRLIVFAVGSLFIMPILGGGHSSSSRLSGLPLGVNTTRHVPASALDRPGAVHGDRAIGSDAFRIGPQNRSTSTTWSGYVYCPSVVSAKCTTPPAGSRIWGVQASLIVPSVLANAPGVPQAAATWLGIGGYNTAGLPSLIQAGVDSTPVGGNSQATSVQVWWEMIPSPPAFVNLTPDSSVSIGDVLFVRVDYSGLNSQGDQVWNFLIEDNSTSSEWNATISCVATSSCQPSTFNSADWVVESPLQGGGGVVSPIPAFSSVEFVHAAYQLDSGMVSYLTGNESTLYEVSMLGAASYTEAVPTSVYQSGIFWVQYLVDVADFWMTQAWGNVTGGTLGPGGSLFANLSIASTSNLSASSGVRLAIAVRVGNGTSVACIATPSPFSPLPVLLGNHTYAIEAQLCPPIPRGTYQTSVTLWYLDQGATPGGNGSQVLFDTGVQRAGVLIVERPTIGLPITQLPLWVPILVVGLAAVVIAALRLRVVRQRGDSAGARALRP